MKVRNLDKTLSPTPAPWEGKGPAGEVLSTLERSNTPTLALASTLQHSNPLTLALAALALLALAGCSHSSSSTSTAEVNTSPKPPATATPTEAKTKPPSSTDSAIPAEVKTTGFEYYGLGNLTPLPMKGTMNGKAIKAVWVNVLTGVDDGRATFQQGWKGDLADTGTSRVTADKTGVYATSVYGKELAEPQLEMPADPKPGRTWNFHASFTGPHQETFLESGTDRLVGERQIKAGGKSYNALLTEETGTLTSGGNSMAITTRKWLVKGLGAVREEIHGKGGDGKPTDIVLEITGS